MGSLFASVGAQGVDSPDQIRRRLHRCRGQPPSIPVLPSYLVFRAGVGAGEGQHRTLCVPRWRRKVQVVGGRSLDYPISFSLEMVEIESAGGCEYLQGMEHGHGVGRAFIPQKSKKPLVAAGSEQEIIK